MTIHISPQSLVVMNDEARIRDRDLAEALEFTKSYNIRKLIQRNLVELERYGGVFSMVEKTSEAGGRPGTEYWLNEGQALRICTISNTSRAADVTYEIINVFMAWRRKRLEASFPPATIPGPVESESVQALYAKIAVVKEARILRGAAFAKGLWRELGLPEAIPAPQPGAEDGRACLDVLMSSRLFDRGCRDELRALLHVVFSIEDELAAAELAQNGLRCVFEGDQGLLVANAGSTLDRVYEGTRWAAMRWRYGLRQIPGVRAHDTAQRFGEQTHRSTFIPLSIALAP